MKMIFTTILLLIAMVSSTYGYGQQSILYEFGDDEMFIGYFALDTQQQLVQSNQFQTNSLTGGNSALGSGGGSGSSGQQLVTKQTNKKQLVDLKVVPDRYQSGGVVYSTLFLELPQQLLSAGGYFEYNLVSPSGVQSPIKTVRLQNNKNKLLYYKIPDNAENGQWKITGIVKANGYKDIQVSDKFKVKDYSVFLYYLLAIISFTSFAMFIYNRKKQYNNI